MITLAELAKKIKNEKRVAIFPHIRPDGDSVGSAFALKLALEKLGVSAEVVCADAIPVRFEFLYVSKNVKISLCGEYSAFIAIDCADITRLGAFAEEFIKHKNTFNIDHHVSNNRYAKENFVLDCAANCENVFNLINELGVEIDSEIANFLATGIVTDTGNFRHKNVRAQTLEIASKLVDKGADLNKIYYYMFTMQSKARAKLFGRVMANIRYFLSDRFAVVSVFEKDIKDCGATPDETEGFIDFVMGINTVEVGACLMEIGKNKYKISFRSKETDVNAVALTFGGGGHTLASGCQISGEYEDIVDRITFAVSRELKD